MLNNLKQRKQEGFTIIEVLIVLAIAGLIMLVVFMAVPALQRNSRTTQKKSDVSSILGSLQETVNNGNGKLPTGATVPPAVAAVKLTQFDTINYLVATTGTPALLTPQDVNTVQVRNGYKCNTAYVDPGTQTTSITVSAGAGSGALVTTSGASLRSVVAIYSIERPGGVSGQCQDV